MLKIHEKFAFAAVGWLYPGALMQTLSNANLTLPSLDLPAIKNDHDDRFKTGLAFFSPIRQQDLFMAD